MNRELLCNEHCVNMVLYFPVNCFHWELFSVKGRKYRKFVVLIFTQEQEKLCRVFKISLML